MRRREEAALEREILLKFGQLDDVAIYKNEIGQGFYGALGPVLLGACSPYGPEHVAEVKAILYRHRVTYGLAVGSPDLVSIVGPHGRFAAAELKSTTGVLRSEQRDWLKRARELGAAVGEIRSVSDFERLIAAARSTG